MKRAVLSAIFGLSLVGLASGQTTAGPEDVLRAAKAGNPEAQLEMGILYEFGFHLPENAVPALAWYMLAAKQGNEVAIKRRDLLMSRMNQAEVERAREQSAQLLADRGRVQ